MAPTLAGLGQRISLVGAEGGYYDQHKRLHLCNCNVKHRAAGDSSLKAVIKIIY